MRVIDELPFKNYENHRREQRNSVGEKAAIRFFNTDDREDMARLRRIIHGQGTQKWMDEVSDLTDEDLRTWAQEKGGWRKRNAFLFAVTPSAGQPDAGEVAGFVYIYGGADERAQARRLVEKGMVPASVLEGKVYETSSAVLPNAEGLQADSGLMASARRQVFAEVDKRSRMNSVRNIRNTIRRAMGLPDPEYQALVADVQEKESTRTTPNTFFYTFIHPDNVSSLRAAQASGFELVGEATYDPAEEDNPEAKKDLVLVLDWARAQQRLAEKSYQSVFKNRDQMPEYVPVTQQAEDSLKLG
jgi:hypothetical protein